MENHQAVTTPESLSPEAVAARAARTFAMQMVEEGGRSAVLVGVARVDAALENFVDSFSISESPQCCSPDQMFHQVAAAVVGLIFSSARKPMAGS